MAALYEETRPNKLKGLFMQKLLNKCYKYFSKKLLTRDRKVDIVVDVAEIHKQTKRY